jgi:DNA-binding transcriptional ArsR family regulator
MNNPQIHNPVTESDPDDDVVTGLGLSDDTVEMVAAMLRVIGDPTRIRLMEILNQEGSVTSGGLAARLGMTPQAVSKQLGVLHQAGVVSRRRKGAWVHYQLVDWTGWWLVERISAALSAGDASG